jgi:hypothetical protein
VIGIERIESQHNPAQEKARDGNENSEYEYFLDRFDSYMRREILGIAAEFGADAEKYIFMLKRRISASTDGDDGTRPVMVSHISQEASRQ